MVLAGARRPWTVSASLFRLRDCETGRLSDEAWRLFGTTAPGWARVQAICDFVHNHITFGYEHSRATRTAAEAYAERRGVCRDYAHLALAFCRIAHGRDAADVPLTLTFGPNTLIGFTVVTEELAS